MFNVKGVAHHDKHTHIYHQLTKALPFSYVELFKPLLARIGFAIAGSILDKFIWQNTQICYDLVEVLQCLIFIPCVIRRPFPVPFVHP